MYTTKKRFKVQIIGIFEEIDSYYWPKMHLWKGAKKFEQGPPPPLIWTKFKRTAAFFSECFLLERSEEIKIANNIHNNYY